MAIKVSDRYICDDNVQCRNPSLTQHYIELEEAEHNLHNLSEAMFTCTGLSQCKYTLHAILMHDGGNGTGHHWAYINMETSGIRIQEEGKTWLRCCDASVVPCTEEEVLGDEALVYSLIYINEDVENMDLPNIGDIIARSLKVNTYHDHLMRSRQRY
jgi:Ubiquitin carboxyl-terminal hydrolase